MLGRTLFLSILFLVSLSYGSESSFTIDQEYKVRKLRKDFSKKYGMKVKIKREGGNLAVKIWDPGFYINKWKITKGGAEFIKEVSKALCQNQEDCEVQLRSHHASTTGESKKKVFKNSQYKMSSVSLQLLQTSISPKHLSQFSLGDSEPLVKKMPADPIGVYSANKLNTRTEITFIPKRGRL